MSKESASQFLNRLAGDAALQQRLGMTSEGIRLEQFQANAAALGYQFSQEELAAAIRDHNENTLTDADLEQVAGGSQGFLNSFQKVEIGYIKLTPINFRGY